MKLSSSTEVFVEIRNPRQTTISVVLRQNHQKLTQQRVLSQFVHPHARSVVIFTLGSPLIPDCNCFCNSTKLATNEGADPGFETRTLEQTKNYTGLVTQFCSNNQVL